MALEIDNVDWCDDPLIFAVRCYGNDHLESKLKIFEWLERTFKTGWRWQLYSDQDNYCMFSITFDNEEDAMFFKLRWS